LIAEVARLRPLAELGRMAATVAHEVRNPLAGISANAELLREAVHDPDDAESVDIILAEVGRLGSLVTDLLLYTRERPPRHDPIDLADIARTACELSQHAAERAAVRLEWEGAGTGYGDRELSVQALLNIIRNAIQACDVDGEVTVLVDGARVEVVDTGNGVPHEVRDHLFEPFVSGRTRGLGLGAAVAHRCLRRQGGEVRLADSGSEGTTVCLAWSEGPSALEA